MKLIHFRACAHTSLCETFFRNRQLPLPGMAVPVSLRDYGAHQSSKKKAPERGLCSTCMVRCLGGCQYPKYRRTADAELASNLRWTDTVSAKLFHLLSLHPCSRGSALVFALGLGSSSFEGLPIRLRTASRTLARPFACILSLSAAIMLMTSFGALASVATSI
jgi:hypothetical protein